MLDVLSSVKHPAGRWIQLLLLLLFVGSVFWMYSPSFQAPLIFDDQRNLFNENLQMIDMSLSSLHKAAVDGELSRRPVANLTFALNYYFHQQDLFGYHIVNIIIHLINGLLLFVLSLKILQLPALSEKCSSPFLVAFCIAFLWAVHPLHTQSVTYIVQRMNSLATMFFLLGFLSYLHWRQSGMKWIYACGVLLSFLLAIGSKEIGATLPVILILFDWYFFQDLKLPPRKQLAVFLFLTLLILTFVVYFFWGSNPFQSIPDSFSNRDFSLSQRLLTESRIVVFYLSLLFFPHPARLNLLHDFPLSNSFFDPISTLFSTAFIVGIIVLALIFAKRERLASFCLLWFVINLIIESTLIPLELIFEHRTYLPSVMMVFLFVSLLFRWIKWQKIGVVLIATVICLSGYWTYQRNIAWSDDVLFWQDCLQKSPNSARAHNNLGYALKTKGKYKEAIAHFYEALRLQPNLALAGYNLKMTQALQEPPKNAMLLYRDAVRINPHNAGAFFNLGVLLAQQGNDTEAIENYREAIRVRPSFAEAHNNLGSALNRLGDMEKALFHYREAVRYNPEDAINHHNLGYVLARARKYEEAVFHLSEAVRLKPDFSKARETLAKVKKLFKAQ